jgi:hypothetical protein
LSIPLHEYSGAADGTLVFLAELDHYNQRKKQATPLRKRQVRTEITLSVGLPLGVNVQDFFRSDQLFSKFIISAGSGGLLRLGSVHLECEGATSKEDAPFEILDAMTKSDTLVTPSQSASFLFAIRRTKSKAEGPINRFLRLTLSYRTLLEEAVQIVLYQLEYVLSKQGEYGEDYISVPHKRCLERSLMAYVKSQGDMSAFFVNGRLQFQPRSEKQWRQIYRQWAGLQGTEEEDRIHKIVEETIQASQEVGMTLDSDSQKEWRELSLIVDVPRMKIVNAVTVRLEDRSGPMRVGQVVRAKVTIETCFYWDDDEEEPVTEEKSEDDIQEAHKINTPIIKELKLPDEDDDDDDDDAASFQDAVSDASGGERDRCRSPLPLGNKDELSVPSNNHRKTSFSKTRSKSDTLSQQPTTIALSIDIQCDFVNWLLVGSKRSVIKIPAKSIADSTNTKSEVSFSLIAIKSGTFCLPSVTIWPLADAITITPPSHAHRDKETNALQYDQEKRRQEQLQSITCDSHITNEAEMITVLPALQGAERKTYWMNL